MLYLLFVSLLWAFSFGLIKGGLNDLPSTEVAFIRLAIALVVFAPFLRVRTLRTVDTVRLLFTGAIQYGLMYMAYLHAFQYLQAYEVALFTVFTPLYISLIHDGFERRLCPKAFLAVLLAVAGGLLIQYKELHSSEWLRGFGLMQFANLCFAFGQIFYRRTMARLPGKKSNREVFGLLYIGAALLTALPAFHTGWTVSTMTWKQAGILLYLGTIASGLGFFLWNIGARRVNPGTLAIFNNLKIPLGILVALFFFGETADGPRLLGGGALMMGALMINAQCSMPNVQ